MVALCWCWCRRRVLLAALIILCGIRDACANTGAQSPFTNRAMAAKLSKCNMPTMMSTNAQDRKQTTPAPIEIASRLQLFADRELIDSLRGLELRLQTPEQRPLPATPSKDRSVLPLSFPKLRVHQSLRLAPRSQMFFNPHGRWQERGREQPIPTKATFH